MLMFGVLLLLGGLAAAVAVILAISKQRLGMALAISGIALVTALTLPVLFGIVYLVPWSAQGTSHLVRWSSSGRDSSLPPKQVTDARQADTDQQIAHLDIHELMDLADAPRIELADRATDSPEVAVPPSPGAKDASERQAPEIDKAAAEPGEVAAASEDDQEKDVPVVEQRDASPSDRAEPPASAEKSAKDKPLESLAADKSVGNTREVSSGNHNRPSWLDDPPKRVGQIWREVLVTDEFATADEAYKAADRQLVLATYNHLLRLTGQSVQSLAERPLSSDSYLAEFPAFTSYGVGIDYIRREIAKDEYLETVERSFGPMKKLYTLIEFSPAVDRELQAQWNAHRRQERFAVVGLSAGSVLGLLSLVWGLLKIDTWTKGYYTKRLFLGVPAAIIGLVLAFLTWFEVIF
jgi:hypothetical protein